MVIIVIIICINIIIGIIVIIGTILISLLYLALQVLVIYGDTE